MKTKLILLLVLMFTQSAFAEKATIPQSVKNLDTNEVGHALVEGNDEDNSNKFYPEHVQEELYSIADQLYLAGIAKLEHTLEFRCKIRQLVKIEEIRAAIGSSDKKKCYKNFLDKFNANNGRCIEDATFNTYFSIKDNDKDKFHKKYHCNGKVSTNKYNRPPFYTNDHKKLIKALYHALYSSAISQYKSRAISDPQNKANEWDMATVKQCKAPFVKLPWVDFKAPSNCVGSKSESNSCANHSECCSGYCIKEIGASAGTCKMETSCYRLLQQNEECGQMPNGRLNAYCDNALIRYHLDPRPEEDKRSSKPAPNALLVKCIETNFNTSEIGECTLAGKEPKPGKPCCSDKVQGGKCVAKLTCDKCLRGGARPTSDQKCCPGFYKSLSGVCIQDFPPLELPIDSGVNHKKIKKKSILKKVLDLLIPSAHAQQPDGIVEQGSGSCVAGVTCSNNLSAEQEEAVNTLRRSCIAEDPNSGKDPSEQEIAACLKQADELRNQFINENLKDGTNNDGQWTRQNYLDRFNMTAITSKTASDFKKCEFNSFNDSWRSASNIERNAEIVIRGFEYTFSGMGTQDYWIDKRGLSIYERAKEVATKVRRYRTELIKQFQEIDRAMACKCIAITGPSKFPDKMNFFNSSCEAEKAELAQTLGSADGTSANANLSKVQKDQAETGETDIGASGISHEKLLMDYIQLRQTAQLKRFNDNADLEKQLTELSEFIINQNWELSWEKPQLLYPFVIKRMAKWLKVVIIVVLVVVAVALTVITLGAAGVAFGAIGGVVASAAAVGAAAASAIGAVAAVAIGAVAVGAAVAGAVMTNNSWNKNDEKVKEFVQNAASRSINASGIERRIHDEVTKDWYNKWFKDYKHFRRFYMYPYFKSGAPEDARHNTTGLPSTIPADKVCEAFGSSRVCFKNAHATMFEGEPRFLLDVKFPEFVDENAFVSDSKFLQKLKTSWANGVQALKNECTSCSDNRSSAKKTDWLDKSTDVSKHEKTFLPDNGNWVPEPMNIDRYFKFHAGVRKYAECIELKKCGAKYLGEDEDAFGFGFLFEEPKDIDNFAVYVYQHHFHWPSLSTSGMVAYPTMAMASYFEAMVYNLRLVGSLAGNRWNQLGELYDKYESDWEKRKKDYALGAAATMGGDSNNAKYSKKFKRIFKRLNFKTGVGVEEFAGTDGKLKDVSGLSEGEITALQNGVNKALAAKLQTEKAKHYNTTIGQTPRGKIKKKAQKKWMEKFSSPLNSMPLSVGGRQLGMLKKTTNNVVNNYSEKDPEKGAVASYTAPKYDFGGASYTPPTSQFKSGDSGVPTTTSKAPLTDNTYLLDSAKKNLSAFQRDDSDSLFKIVSKAYFRNLSRVLHRNIKTSKEIETDFEIMNKKKIDSSKKDELKNLLEN